MTLFRKLFGIAGCFILTACAVSSKPEEQSTWGVIVATSTGQNDKTLADMRKELDALSARVKGIDQTLDDYRGQLFAVKRELAGYELTVKERDALLAQIQLLEKQTKDVAAMNLQNESLIENKKVQIETKKTEQKVIESGIQNVEQQISLVEKQATAIEDGIKQIAAIRARQALES